MQPNGAFARLVSSRKFALTFIAFACLLGGFEIGRLIAGGWDWLVALTAALFIFSAAGMIHSYRAFRRAGMLH